jgi:hypothetical protein
LARKKLLTDKPSSLFHRTVSDDGKTDLKCRRQTSPATVVTSKATKKTKTSKATTSKTSKPSADARPVGPQGQQRIVIDGKLKTVVERFTEEGGIIMQVPSASEIS